MSSIWAMRIFGHHATWTRFLAGPFSPFPQPFRGPFSKRLWHLHTSSPSLPPSPDHDPPPSRRRTGMAILHHVLHSSSLTIVPLFASSLPNQDSCRAPNARAPCQPVRPHRGQKCGATSHRRALARLHRAGARSLNRPKNSVRFGDRERQEKEKEVAAC